MNLIHCDGSKGDTVTVGVKDLDSAVEPVAALPVSSELEAAMSFDPPESLRYETRDRKACLTLNRPQRMNAFDLELGRAIGEAIQEFEQDDNLLIAMIRGEGGRAFSAGADIKEMTEYVGSVVTVKQVPNPGGDNRLTGDNRPDRSGDVVLDPGDGYGATDLAAAGDAVQILPRATAPVRGR